MIPEQRYSGSAAKIGAWMAAMETNSVPEKVAVKKIDEFCHLALVVVDAGDEKNYPSHSRTFMETGQYYYGDIFNGCDDVDDLEKRMHQWLQVKGLDNPKTAEWFATNWTWEHIMGGGEVSDIPKEWRDKYLRTEINGRTFGFPTIHANRKWSEYDEAEKVGIYRMVTNNKFTEAMFSFWPEEISDKKMARLTGLVQIYQLLSDEKHSKNEGEPVLSKVMEEIQRNSGGNYSELEEVMYLCKVTGLSSLMGIAAYFGGLMVTRSKRAEWDSQV